MDSTQDIIDGLDEGGPAHPVDDMARGTESDPIGTDSSDDEERAPKKPRTAREGKRKAESDSDESDDYEEVSDESDDSWYEDDGRDEDDTPLHSGKAAAKPTKQGKAAAKPKPEKKNTNVGPGVPEDVMNSMYVHDTLEDTTKGGPTTIVLPVLEVKDEFKSVKDMFTAVASPEGPIIAYTKVDAAVSVTCETLDEEHRLAVRHMLNNGFVYKTKDKEDKEKTDRTPGIHQVFRNCTLLTLNSSFPLYEELMNAGVKIAPHIERAWRIKKRRCFQGVRTKKDVKKEGNFRKLTYAEVERLDPALYKLPFVNDKEKNILVCYGGDPKNDMCRPHGIAKGESTKPHDWHTEPGGNTLVYITRNAIVKDGKSPTYESAGFFLRTTRFAAEANLVKRLEMYQRNKHPGIHDDRVLKWACENPGRVTLAMTNYVCASCDTLPLTWAGSIQSDIMGVTGLGVIHNRVKYNPDYITYVDYMEKGVLLQRPIVQFHLRQGSVALIDIPQGGADGWPEGIRPPEALLEWAKDIGTTHGLKQAGPVLFKPVDSLVKLAQKYPKIFLIYFPEFDEKNVYDAHKKQYTFKEHPFGM